MKKPLISIVVPVYNVEEYLPECVDSLLSQDYEPIEIILVDDGSPDRCGSICDEYANTYQNIVALHKANSGLSDARNYGMKYAKGDYICFVDSDDYVSEKYISHLYEAIESTDSDLAISWFKCVFDHENKKNNDIIQGIIKVSSKECLEKLLYQDGVETSAWGKLYKKELLNGLEYPKGKLYEDIPVTVEAIIRAESVSIIQNVDYFYRQRRDSIQYQSFNIRKLDCIAHIDNMRKRIEGIHPDLTRAIDCREYSALCNILFQIPSKSEVEIRKKLWNRLKMIRKSVLSNKKAKQKNRIAAFVSYFGFNIMSFVYHSTQARG